MPNFPFMMGGGAGAGFDPSNLPKPMMMAGGGAMSPFLLQLLQKNPQGMAALMGGGGLGAGLGGALPGKGAGKE